MSIKASDRLYFNRFAELYNILLKVPKERFDMKHWKQEASCGTIHCAGGWYVELAGETELRMSGTTIFHGRTATTGFYALANEFGVSWPDALEIFTAPKTTDGYLRETPEQYLIRLSQFMRKRWPSLMRGNAPGVSTLGHAKKASRSRKSRTRTLRSSITRDGA